MRRVDHVSLYFGILLAVTVILKCESRRYENEQSETVTLTRSGLRNTTHPSRHHSQYRAEKIIRNCNLCKIVVRGLMSYVSIRYTRRTNALCHIFLRKHQKKCQETVQRKLRELKPKLMKKLFPGGAEGVCRKIKACK